MGRLQGKSCHQRWMAHELVTLQVVIICFPCQPAAMTSSAFEHQYHKTLESILVI